ncbi:Pyruvate/Phosphoenolpyruvate kinase-like domain-containing protein [Haematococcus lacustris]
MSRIGLSVPPGLTLTTAVCAEFHANGRQLPPGCWEEMLQGLLQVEQEMGCKLGNPANPLLLSVRSGAAISMPGMMDTVLNLGLNDAVVEGLASKAGERFAFDAYRRFLDMFGGVVMDVPHSLFEHQMASLKHERGCMQDTDLSAADLRVLVARYKEVYRSRGKVFPEDPYDQLHLAISAVFDSWQSDRAKVYLAVNQITGLKGTAVNVQAMAYGNMGNSSGTGVCFTRNPSNGERKLYGEYLINAQGEDVVAGIRTPEPIDRLAETLPEAYAELVRNCNLLERHYKDMQDIEFTVQEGKLFMLQCRSGKRTGAAAVKIAVDAVAEGLVTPEQAICMVEPTHLDQLLHPQFADEAGYKEHVLGSGLPASPGAAVGQAVFTAEDAEAWKAAGLQVVLVRKETSPEDVKGMFSAEGVLCQLGGMTSHAAVVARGWGKPCITGVAALQVDEHAKVARINGHEIREGAFISLNGTSGEIVAGKQPLAPPELAGDLGTFMAWVDGARKLKVLTNADTPADAAEARKFGAQGIGLCRTEHMFFASEERIAAMRRMVVAQTKDARLRALKDLLPFQRQDFQGIFRAMDGLPVTIRLLDPPLHEFLPDGEMEEVCQALATDAGITLDQVFETIDKLQEVNPMLGFRGCRLGITYPEITEMQVQAIFEAAVACSQEGVLVLPDIMVPLVGSVPELADQEGLVRRVAERVMKAAGVQVQYHVGTMIEVPRAALMADSIAKVAEFFSFGTNDLTQMTYGFSRDDISKFLPTYLEKGILQSDPFQVLDQEGVGQLVRMAVERGRATRPDLKIGLCGEQGGEPSTVVFLHNLGLDYVSCSPFRVPIARLAAAQAAVQQAKL